MERAATQKLEASELRASLAYFGTCFQNNVLRLPDTLATDRGEDGAYRLRCNPSCPCL